MTRSARRVLSAAVTSVTPIAREVARAAASAFRAENPTVRSYLDDGETHAVDLLACVGRPATGLTTYSTVTLHEARNLLDGKNVPVELAGVAATDEDVFPNVLATAAFYVIKDRWLAAPGVVFPALLADYGVTSALEHVLWVPPFLWEELNGVEVTDEIRVHWLLGVPVSDPERAFLVSHGFDALEQLFTEREVDYFNLSRSSVI